MKVVWVMMHQASLLEMWKACTIANTIPVGSLIELVPQHIPAPLNLKTL